MEFSKVELMNLAVLVRPSPTTADVELRQRLNASLDRSRQVDGTDGLVKPGSRERALAHLDRGGGLTAARKAFRATTEQLLSECDAAYGEGVRCLEERNGAVLRHGLWGDVQAVPQLSGADAETFWSGGVLSGGELATGIVNRDGLSCYTDRRGSFCSVTDAGGVA